MRNYGKVFVLTLTSILDPSQPASYWINVSSVAELPPFAQGWLYSQSNSSKFITDLECIAVVQNNLSSLRKLTCAKIYSSYLS